MKDDYLGYKILVSVLLVLAIFLSFLYQANDDIDMNRYKSNYYQWEVLPSDALNEWNTDTYYYPYADMLIFVLPLFSVLMASFMIVNEYEAYKLDTSRGPWLLGAIVVGLISVTSFFWLETNKPRSGGLYDVRLDVFANHFYVFINMVMVAWFLYNAIIDKNKKLLTTLGLVTVINVISIVLTGYHIYWFIGFLVTASAILMLLLLGTDLRNEYLKIKE